MTSTVLPARATEDPARAVRPTRHRLSRQHRLRRRVRRTRVAARGRAGAAVDGLQLTFLIVGELLFLFAVLTVVIGFVSLVMGAGR
jgi:hypothetical protein